MKLSEVQALITGGGTGIGYETARILRAAGAGVVLCGRREDVLRRAADELGATTIAADVSQEEDVLRLVDGAVEALGGLNVLINNAAFGGRAPLVEVDTETFRAVHATNVVGAMMVARECAKHMIARGAGTIVNVGSTAAGKGYPTGSAYASSKFALTGLTECWRAELRPHGIRVMQVNPSEVLTPFGGRDMTAPQNPTKLRAEEVAHVIRAMLEMDDRGFITDATIFATNPK
ncbi:MAG: SDR family oxidoreductase [Planctomycetota bacterium]